MLSRMRSLKRFPKSPRRRWTRKRTLTKRALERLRENIFRDDVLNARRRPDGRAFDQIRLITCEVGLLPRVHGSALFTRGETQALATLTLGTKEDMQRLDLLFEQDQFNRFMLQLQLPAVQRRRSEIPSWPGPPRNWPRRPRAARAREPASPRSGFSLCHAPRLRHFGIQRFPLPWLPFAAVLSR